MKCPNCGCDGITLGSHEVPAAQYLEITCVSCLGHMLWFGQGGGALLARCPLCNKGTEFRLVPRVVFGTPEGN